MKAATRKEGLCELSRSSLGPFAVGEKTQATTDAMALFRDAASVAVYAESFGGADQMTAEKAQFIRNWKVEKYRVQQGAGTGGR